MARPAFRRLLRSCHRSEKFLAGRHAAYLYCVDGILESKAGAALLGKAGRHATTRNLATTLKLCELANAAGNARKNEH